MPACSGVDDWLVWTGLTYWKHFTYYHQVLSGNNLPVVSSQSSSKQEVNNCVESGKVLSKKLSEMVVDLVFQVSPSCMLQLSNNRNIQRYKADKKFQKLTTFNSVEFCRIFLIPFQFRTTLHTRAMHTYDGSSSLNLDSNLQAPKETMQTTNF